MKIVDRKAFMQMPKGTVYCKFPRYNAERRSYEDYLFGIDEPQIKMNDPFGDDVDFFTMGIGSGLCPVYSTDDDDYFSILEDMEANLGKEVDFEYCDGRDGLFESNEKVGFAIFSRTEVELMIKTLQESLATAYSPSNKIKLED